MSTYIKLSTLEYPRHVGDIEIDPAGMSDYAPVDWVDPPPFDASTQRRVQIAPQQQGDKWSMVWQVVPIPQEELALKVRIERNSMLDKSDWTQVADAPVNKAIWAIYRQALRDVTIQPGFPYTVQWPEKPA